MNSAVRASTASDMPANAAIIPFPAQGERLSSSGSSKLSRSERNALIGFGYAVPGWLVLFEQDGLGMHWVALCPPGAGPLVARYIVGREDNALMLLTGGGRTLGRYRSAEEVVAQLRRRECPRAVLVAEDGGKIARRRLGRAAAPLVLVGTGAPAASG